MEFAFRGGRDALPRVLNESTGLGRAEAQPSHVVEQSQQGCGCLWGESGAETSGASTFFTLLACPENRFHQLRRRLMM